MNIAFTDRYLKRAGMFSWKAATSRRELCLSSCQEIILPVYSGPFPPMLRCIFCRALAGMGYEKRLARLKNPSL